MGESVLTKEQKIFEQYPVPKAVAAMAIPTIISQIVHVIYNLADTWFVGLTENRNAVAALALSLPVYNMMTAFSNLFGLGGDSVIARALGAGNSKKARAAFSVSFWGSVFVSLFYTVILLLFCRPILLLIGGDETNIDFACQYTMITIIIGGPPTIIATTLAHLIRANGSANTAGIGLTVGAVLNIILDPLFMFVILPPGNEVIGAGIATTIANTVSLIYFLMWIAKQKGEGIFDLSPRHLLGGGELFREIFVCGLPGFALMALPMVSNGFLNSLVSKMGSSAAVGGIGIVRKVDSLAYRVNQGINQGMLPLVSYCYASGRRKRMKDVIIFSTACTFIFSLVASTTFIILAPDVIRLFIRDADTIFYGAGFLRVLSISVILYSPTLVIATVFQAIGKVKLPVFLMALRRGTLDVALFYIFRNLFGYEYVIWASPIMEAAALAVAIVMLVRLLKQIVPKE